MQSQVQTEKRSLLEDIAQIITVKIYQLILRYQPNCLCHIYNMCIIFCSFLKLSVKIHICAAQQLQTMHVVGHYVSRIWVVSRNKY